MLFKTIVNNVHILYNRTVYVLNVYTFYVSLYNAI